MRYSNSRELESGINGYQRPRLLGITKVSLLMQLSKSFWPAVIQRVNAAAKRPDESSLLNALLLFIANAVSPSRNGTEAGKEALENGKGKIEVSPASEITSNSSPRETGSSLRGSVKTEPVSKPTSRGTDHLALGESERGASSLFLEAGASGESDGELSPFHKGELLVYPSGDFSECSSGEMSPLSNGELSPFPSSEISFFQEDNHPRHGKGGLIKAQSEKSRSLRTVAKIEQSGALAQQKVGALNGGHVGSRQASGEPANGPKNKAVAAESMQAEETQSREGTGKVQEKARALAGWGLSKIEREQLAIGLLTAGLSAAVAPLFSTPAALPALSVVGSLGVDIKGMEKVKHFCLERLTRTGAFVKPCSFSILNFRCSICQR
jgi:hypothetical protein